MIIVTEAVAVASPYRQRISSGKGNFHAPGCRDVTVVDNIAPMADGKLLFGQQVIQLLDAQVRCKIATVLQE